MAHYSIRHDKTPFGQCHTLCEVTAIIIQCNVECCLVQENSSQCCSTQHCTIQPNSVPCVIHSTMLTIQRDLIFLTNHVSDSLMIVKKCHHFLSPFTGNSACPTSMKSLQVQVHINCAYREGSRINTLNTGTDWFTLAPDIDRQTGLKSTDTDQGLNFISGIGTHVNVTVSSRNGLRPQISDRAPISGALRNDSRP